MTQVQHVYSPRLGVMPGAEQAMAAVKEAFPLEEVSSRGGGGGGGGSSCFSSNQTDTWSQGRVPTGRGVLGKPGTHPGRHFQWER